ncbi:MAG: NAD(P)-dependent oxidoreductase [Dysgonamonadaceae bacterium]|jgi:nucleoside-diphosphate-sugar epimerase|nr:NAD(P)-dependent oxidoreductase [Dysgonamonadaceae bacterium]
MKKILITGASGFIGSFLVEEAIRREWQTWAGIRKTSSKKFLQDKQVQFIDLSFSDKLSLTKQIQQHVSQYGKWDYIVHNAGVTKCLNPADFDKVNYFFTKNLVESLIETGNIPEKFILMSSLSAHHPEAHTVYGQSKLKAEKWLESQTRFPYIIIQPTGVYGPREKDYYIMLKTIKSGLDIAAGMKPQILSFIYVKDLIRVVFLALESEITNKSYPVADGKSYTDEEYTRIAKNALNKKHVLKLRVPLFILKTVSILAEGFSKMAKQPSTLNRDKYQIMKQRDWSCDISAIRNDFHFEAEYDLEKGMRECVSWYKENKWL